MCSWHRRRDRRAKGSSIRPAGNHFSATALRPGLSALPRVGRPLPCGSTAVLRHGDPLSAHAEPAHDVLVYPFSGAPRCRCRTQIGVETPGSATGSPPHADLRRQDPDHLPVLYRVCAASPHGSRWRSPDRRNREPPVPQLTDGPNAGRIPAGPPARDPMHKGRRLLPRRSRLPHPSGASGSVGASADRHRVWEQSITNCACRGRRRRKQPPNTVGP